MKFIEKKDVHIYDEDGMKIRYNIKTDTARFHVQGKDIRRVNDGHVSEQQFIQNLIDEFSAQDNQIDILIQDYLKYHSTRKAKATLKAKKTFTNYISRYFDFNPNEIDRLKLIDGLMNVQEHHSVDIRNRVLKELRMLIDHGIEYGLIKERYNVARQIKLQSVPPSEKRPKKFFELQTDVENKSHHTIQRLLSVAKTPQQRLLIILLANTGGRIMECMRLRWSDIYWHEIIDPDTGERGGTYAFNIRNSKTRRHGDEENVTYRQFDITPATYDAIMEQKKIIDAQKAKLKKEYKESGGVKHRRCFEVTREEANDNRCADTRVEHKWDWIICNKYGSAPGYTCGRKWYLEMWKRAHDKYKDDKAHPWPYGDKPVGLTPHAFRRYWTCETREYYNRKKAYTKTVHEWVQQSLGHRPGSPVTDKEYTEWKSSRVVDSKLNNEVRIDLV